MKLIYKGKYSGNPEDIPHGEHRPGAVKFREFESSRALGIFANILSLVIIAGLFGIAFMRAGFQMFGDFACVYGCIASMFILFPHEILHAVCFKKEVYLYTNWKEGMLFVVGPEDMSKARFIFMSLLPNLVFGALPFLIFLLFPQCVFLGVFGTLAIGMGAGDYYNVFNAATQMPKGARTYLYGFNSYWYLP